jgi:hypothetical protein
MLLGQCRTTLAIRTTEEMLSLLPGLETLLFAADSQIGQGRGRTDSLLAGPCRSAAFRLHLGTATGFSACAAYRAIALAGECSPLGPTTP